MDNFRKAAALAVGAAMLAGCDGISVNVMGQGIKGSGTLKSESRSVGSFDKIKANGIEHVTVKVGNSESVEVKTDDNLLKHVLTEVKDGVLVISEKDSVNTKNEILVTVTVPKLSGIQLNGTGEFEVSGVNGASFKVSIGGTGEAKVSGAVDSLNVNLSGTGDAQLFDLKAADVKVDLSGTGAASVTAEKTLDVKCSGTGDVTYRGNATVTKSISGTGSVQKG